MFSAKTLGAAAFVVALTLAFWSCLRASTGLNITPYPAAKRGDKQSPNHSIEKETLPDKLPDPSAKKQVYCTFSDDLSNGTWIISNRTYQPRTCALRFVMNLHTSKTLCAL
jgi:hypothetical protein